MLMLILLEHTIVLATTIHQQGPAEVVEPTDCHRKGRELEPLCMLCGVKVGSDLSVPSLNNCGRKRRDASNEFTGLWRWVALFVAMIPA